MPFDIAALLNVGILSMVPLIESRLAIPFGVAVLGLSPLAALTGAFLGNVVLLLILTPLVYRFGNAIAKKSDIFAHVLRRTQRVRASRFTNISRIGLVLFIALPLPMSGIWSGTLASFIFGIPALDVLRFGALGGLLGCIFVTFIVTGFTTIF